MLFYLSYLRAFRKYANRLLNESTKFSEIGNYANLLTDKARELIDRASLNMINNPLSLQKEMYEAGSAYIKKFAVKFRAQQHAPYEHKDRSSSSVSSKVG